MKYSGLVEMHAIIHGKVQGVFFRETTRQKANELEVTGTVKNLTDGTVEILAVGRKGAIDALILFLTGGKGPGEVVNTDLSFSEPKNLFEEFRIVF